MILLLLFFLHQKPDPIKEKVCNIWISYELTEHLQANSSHKTHKINSIDSDSLVLMSNGSFVRFNHEIKYEGQWSFKNYSTKIVADPMKSFVDNSIPDLNELVIFELKDDLLILKYYHSEDGNSTVIKYRRAKPSPNGCY